MLKNRLRERRLTLGSWISLGHPAIAEIMARAGFDWLVIDHDRSLNLSGIDSPPLAAPLLMWP